jgi:acetyl-CoA acyltransferase
MSRDVVIVDAVRTPIGRGRPASGAYSDVHPHELLGTVYREVLSRTGVEPGAVEGVIAGCVQQIGEQAWNVARQAWLSESLPIETPAMTVDAQCGSSQQAVNLAATMIAGGVQDVMIAGGVEHMGHISFAKGGEAQDLFGSAFPPKLQDAQGFGPRHNLEGQGLGAEMIADRWNVSREEMDELALRSHQLAAAASDGGHFEQEIIPVQTGAGAVEADEGIRRETSLETLSSLPSIFKENGRITAGTSSQISDGAAAVLLMSDRTAADLELRPRARIVDQAFVGSDPLMMLTGPIPATQKILARNGLAIDDIDVIEINEAFAPVVAAWQREIGPDPERVNPRGGAMALGHPLGATGARLMTTLLHEMEDEGHHLGLVTMCCGGGLGTATLIELLD